MRTGKPMFTQADPDVLSDYSLQLNRWMLKPIGTWPNSSTDTKLQRIISLVSIVSCYFLILITLIPCVLHLILEDDDIRTKLSLMGPMSYWLFGGVGYTALLVHNKEIRWCVEQVKSDWRAVTGSKMQQAMMKDAKFARHVITFCSTFMQGGVLCFNVSQACTTQVIRAGNESRTVHVLPCAVYRKLVPVDTSPTNEIFVVVQLVSGVVVTSTVVGAFSLATAFTFHVYGQLNLLMERIAEDVDRSSLKGRLNGIGAIARKHLTILSFIARIEIIMSEICFMQFFQCIFSICMLGYFILMEWAKQEFQNIASYALILSSVTFNIFLLCFIGEMITEQCNKVADATYMSNWYNLPAKDVLDLMLIIIRSSVEIRLTAGKMVHMSFDTFASVIKTGFAYLNVLRQTI